jgi:hypothetical protein
LEEEVYIEHAEGFHLSEKEKYVCRVKKELYGLKQDPEHVIQYWKNIYSNKGSGKEMKTIIST